MAFEYREPIKVLADIIQHELGLADGRVMLADQKFNIANQKGLYISLEYVNPGKIIANINTPDMTVNPPVEVQSVTSVSVVQVDMMSFDETARTQMDDVAMALNSTYSVQQQERYQLQISRNPAPFNDNSNLEITAMLKRYTTTVTITSMKIKSKVVEYFDTFQTPEVHNNA